MAGPCFSVPCDSWEKSTLLCDVVFELCVKILTPDHNDCCDEREGLSSTEETGGGVTESLRSCTERHLLPKYETTPFIDRLAPCSSGHEPPLFLSGYLSFCMCTPLPASPPDCEIQNPAVVGGGG